MYRVLDTSRMILSGSYPEEQFETLAEAFAHVAKSIEGGATEIEIHEGHDGGAYDYINIDASGFAS
jgi:hypothetical protein